jgi:hypothetical protein
MARPIPVSNKKARQWNEFLLDFNNAAAAELPLDANGKPNYSLLDDNKPFGTYSGGQDFYTKQFNKFKQKNNYTAADDVSEADFPKLQLLFTDIYNTVQQDQTPYKAFFDDKQAKLLSAFNGDPNTFNPNRSARDKETGEGWIGRDTRFFFIPMEDGPLTGSSGKHMILPESFDEGDLDQSGNPIYQKNPKRDIGGTFYKFEDGGMIEGKEEEEEEDDDEMEESPEHEASEETLESKNGIKEIADDTYKVIGKTHEKGGVKTKINGKNVEVEKGEIIDMTTEDGIVLSNNLQLAEFDNKTPAKLYEEILAEEKKYEGDNRNWVKNKLAFLAEKKSKIIALQQERNGNQSTTMAENGTIVPAPEPGGGEVDPPKKKRLFYTPDNVLYEVAEDKVAKHADILKNAVEYTEEKPEGYSNPTKFYEKNGVVVAVPQDKLYAATEYVKSQFGVQDLTDIKELYLANTGQKKNKDVQSIYEDTDAKFSKNTGIFGANTQVDLNEVGASEQDLFNYDKALNDYTSFIKKIPRTEGQPTAYNEILETGYLDKLYPNDIDLLKDASRKMRDEDNELVGKKFINDLQLEKDDIIKEYKIQTSATGWMYDIEGNITKTKEFRDHLDRKLNASTIEIDGKKIDFQSMPGSQKEEIRNYVIGNYNTVQDLKKSQDHIAWLTDPNPTGDKEADDIKLKQQQAIFNKTGVDITTLHDEGYWMKMIDGFKKKADSINQEYANLASKLPYTIKEDLAPLKTQYEFDDNQLTQTGLQELELLKKDLQFQLDNGQIDEESANKKLDEAFTGLEVKRTEMFNQYNRDLNQKAQLKIQAATETLKLKFEAEITEGLKEFGLDGTDVIKNAENYNKLLMWEFGNIQTDQMVRLQNEATRLVDYKGDWEQIKNNLNRGTLQMFEGLGGGIKWLGGYEMGNIMTDAMDEYNATNPQQQVQWDGIESLMNKDWWIERGVTTIPSTLMFVLPGIGISGAAGKTAAAIGLEGLEASLFQGFAGALATRPLESFIEAGTQFNTDLENGMNVDEASDRAASVFTDNLKLIFTDGLQLGLAFTKFGKLSGIKAGLIKMPIEAIMEGSEEVYQELAVEKLDNPYATFLSYIASPAGQETFALGALMATPYALPDIVSISSGKTNQQQFGLLMDMIGDPNNMDVRYSQILNQAEVQVARGSMTQTEFKQLQAKAEFVLSKNRDIPIDLAPEVRKGVLYKLADIADANNVINASQDPTIQNTYKDKIKELEKGVKELIAGKEPMYFINNAMYTKEEFNEVLSNDVVMQSLADQNTPIEIFNDDTMSTALEERMAEFRVDQEKVFNAVQNYVPEIQTEEVALTTEEDVTKASVLEDTKESSVGVGGDVEFTAKALEGVIKDKVKTPNDIPNTMGTHLQNLTDGSWLIRDGDKSKEWVDLVNNGIKEIENIFSVIPFSEKTKSILKEIKEKVANDNYDISKEVSNLSEATKKEFYRGGEGWGVKEISEAYHKAKADGSNPELVKAVEQSLKKEPTALTPTKTKEASTKTQQTNVTNQNKTINNENIQEKQLDEKSTVAIPKTQTTTIQGGPEEIARNTAKREEIKQSLKDLRDQGLLVTADKSLLAKAKKLVGKSSAPVKMTDAEIDAQISLLDSMAKVWKDTTGKDNFYDKFIADVKKGDITALNKMGGALFQEAESTRKPTSRVTLGVFNEPQFVKMEGQSVNPQSISDFIKGKGKQIEKDIINQVLSYDKYKGQKRIPFDEFKNDVELQLMKLEKIKSSSYATYGKDNLGYNEDYGNAETIILNTPLDHGETGHFSGDFISSQVENKNWEVKQLGDTNTWAAVDKDMPAGTTAQDIQNYVGTAGSKAEVERWVNQRNQEKDINKGLFGHLRAWFNKSTKVFTLAEQQSDVYQKHKASELFAEKIPQDEIDEYMNREIWAPMHAKYLQELKEHTGFTTVVNKEDRMVYIYDNKGNQIGSAAFRDNPSPGYKVGEVEEAQLFTSTVQGIYEYSDFIKDFKDRYDEERNSLKHKEQQYISKRVEEAKASGKIDLIQQQFIASQKVHELRLFREAINYAAELGAETLRFPTPYTLAVIEGYVDKSGEGNAPYDIIDGDSDGLDVGDIIDYGGEKMRVVESNSYDFKAISFDESWEVNVDDYIYEEVNNRWSEIEYEAKRHFDNLSAITKEELESYSADEWMAYHAKDLLEAEFEELEDGETVSWDDIENKLREEIQDNYSRMDYDDLFGGYGGVWDLGYGRVVVSESRGYETFNQPDGYSGDSSEEGFENDLSREQQTVVNKYKELGKLIEKMRPDATIVEDDNGMKWIETKITDEDASNPIIAFQKEGGKAKAAVDFINDNKATIYIFDGADISSLAHEMTGHLGRRFLESLAKESPAFAKEYNTVKKWAGVKGDKWSTRAEEKFARAFERYLREGISPTKELQSVFSKLKEWLSSIYKSIKGSSIDVELTDEIREVFDSILGGRKDKVEATPTPKKTGKAVVKTQIGPASKKTTSTKEIPVKGGYKWTQSPEGKWTMVDKEGNPHKLGDRSMNNYERQLVDKLIENDEFDTKQNSIKSDVADPEIISEIELSTNPNELLKTINNAKEYMETLETSPEGVALEMLQAGVKRGSFVEYGDENLISESIVRTYDLKKGSGTTLDNISQYLEGKGVIMSESDLVDLMTTYPGGIKQFLNGEVPALKAAEGRLSELGINYAYALKKLYPKSFRTTQKGSSTQDFPDVPFSKGNQKTVGKQFGKEMQKLLNALRAGAPNIKVNFVTDEFLLGLKMEANKYLNITNNSGIPIGAYNPKTGEIYYNEKSLDPGTAIEEFAHMWLHVLKEVKSDIYNKATELIQATQFFRDIVNSEEYGQSPLFIQRNEAIAKAMRAKTEDMVNQTGLKKVIGQIMDLIKELLSKLGINASTLNLNSTLEDIINKGSKELIANRPWTLTDSINLMGKNARAEEIISINYQLSEDAKLPSGDPNKFTKEELKEINDRLAELTDKGANKDVNVTNASVIRLMKTPTKVSEWARKNLTITKGGNPQALQSKEGIIGKSKRLEEQLKREYQKTLTKKFMPYIKKMKPQEMTNFFNDVNFYLTNPDIVSLTGMPDDIIQSIIGLRQLINKTTNAFLGVMNPDTYIPHIGTDLNLYLTNNFEVLRRSESEISAYQVQESKEILDLNDTLQSLNLDQKFSTLKDKAAKLKAELKDLDKYVEDQEVKDSIKDLLNSEQVMESGKLYNYVQYLIKEKYSAKREIANQELYSNRITEIDYNKTDQGYDITVVHADGRTQQMILQPNEVKILFKENRAATIFKTESGNIEVDLEENFVLQNNALYEKLQKDKERYVTRAFYKYETPEWWKANWETYLNEHVDEQGRVMYDVAANWVKKELETSRVRQMTIQKGGAKGKDGYYTYTATNAKGVQSEGVLTESQFEFLNEANGGFIKPTDFEKIKKDLKSGVEQTFGGELDDQKMFTGWGKEQFIIPFSVSDNVVNQTMKNLATGSNVQTNFFQMGADIDKFKGDILKRKQEIPEELKYIYGEITDPSLTVFKTLMAQTLAINSYNTFNTIATENGLFTDNPTGMISMYAMTQEEYERYEGLRPSIREEMIPVDGTKLFMAGAKNNGTIYLTKEAHDIFFPEPAKINNSITRLYFMLASIIKFTYTNPNIASRSRNVLSNQIAYYRSGALNFNPLKPGASYKHMLDAVNVIYSDFTTKEQAVSGFMDIPTTVQRALGLVRQKAKGMTQAELIELKNEVIELGLDEGSLDSADFERLQEGSITEMLAGYKETNTKNWIKKREEKLKAGVKRVTKGYGAADTILRTAIYFREKEMLMKANEEYKKMGKQEIPIAQLKKMAAEKAIRITPVYSRLPEVARTLGTIPGVGTFFKWSASQFRVTYNQFVDATQEMQSDNQVIRRNGWRKFGSYAGMAMVGPVIAALMKMKYDIDDDEEEAVRTVDPSWLENSLWIPLDKPIINENGNVEIRRINFSFVDPSSMWHQGTIAFLRSDNAVEGTINGLGQLAAPFVGSDILLNTLSDINRGENDYGAPLFKAYDSKNEKIMKGTGYFLEKMVAPEIKSVKELGKDWRTEVQNWAFGVKITQKEVNKTFNARMRKIEEVFNSLEYDRKKERLSENDYISKSQDNFLNAKKLINSMIELGASPVNIYNELDFLNIGDEKEGGFTKYSLGFDRLQTEGVGKEKIATEVTYDPNRQWQPKLLK